MTLRRSGLGLLALLALVLTIAGCCGKGGSSGSSSGGGATAAKLGERFKGPGSDFTLLVEKAVTAESLGDTKPLAAGSHWVVVYYKLKNEGKEAKSHLLEFTFKLKDKDGATYDSSVDGRLPVLIEEPEATKTTFDNIPVGTEIPDFVVFGVPADKVKGELTLVVQEAITLGAPKSVEVKFTPTPRPSSGGAPSAGAGSAAPKATAAPKK